MIASRGDPGWDWTEITTPGLPMELGGGAYRCRRRIADLLATAESCRRLRSGRGTAIANPVRHHRFLGRYLSNVALMDRRVSAVTFDTNLGLDRRGTSTDLLENITVVCLPKVLGITGSHFERREFRLQCLRWVDTAGHLPVDWQAAGLQPIIRLTVALKRSLELPQPAAKSRTVIRETCGT